MASVDWDWKENQQHSYTFTFWKLFEELLSHSPSAHNVRKQNVKI